MQVGRMSKPSILFGKGILQLHETVFPEALENAMICKEKKKKKKKKKKHAGLFRQMPVNASGVEFSHKCRRFPNPASKPIRFICMDGLTKPLSLGRLRLERFNKTSNQMVGQCRSFALSHKQPSISSRT